MVKKELFLFVLSTALAAVASEVEIAPNLRAQVTWECSGDWKVSSSVEGTGLVRELVLDAVSPTSAVPPRVTVSFRVPQVDVNGFWKSAAVTDFPMDWNPPAERASILQNQPLYALLDANGGNRLTLASREALRETHFTVSYDESTCEVKCRFSCFVDKVAPETNVAVRVRFDARPIAYGASVGEGAAWMSADPQFVPAVVPDVTHDHVYSSWYVFHKDLFADVLERECAIAAKLGMKTLIVDDGWQDEADGVKDYANVGGFTISKRRFPDMKAHVARVQALGMKYLLWYPISLVGMKSPDYPRFKGKYLAEYKHLAAATLDPRLPDVREYLISGFEQAMREYGFDGFKIDFLDMFPFGEGDPKTPGRDYAGVPQAVDRLMTDLLARLKAVNPEVLVEFRQCYVGPAIRKFGNIIRVADCPGNFRANRLGIAQLRLTSGKAAVHSDMLRWHVSDSAESASRFVLNSIFGTIQYSVRLETLPAAHRNMVAHWLRFAAAHGPALRHGVFRAEHPESGCPVVIGESADERIIGLYEQTSVASVGCGRTVYVLNATDAKEIYVDCPAVPTEVAAVDTFGNPAKTPAIGKGVSRVAVPRGGYLRIVVPDVYPDPSAPQMRTTDPTSWYGARWHAKQAEIARSGGAYDLILVGDSITHFWEPCNFFHLSGTNELAILRRQRKVLDLGFAGDGTEHVLWRLGNGELDGYTAKWFVLLIGTNNKRGTPEEVARGTETIVRLIRAKQPTARIVLIPILPRCDAWFARTKKINALTARLVDGKSVFGLDLAAQFTDAEGVPDRRLFAPDGVHLMPAGYALWRESLEAFFDKNKEE